MIRAEIKNREQKVIENINKTKMWFSVEITTDKSLAMWTKKKRGKTLILK